jgi:threonine/homoserine/homoserine lactone efflux protein
LYPKEHVPLQFAVLSVTFLTIAVLLDSCWAIAATRLKSVFALRGRLRSRVTGGLLLGAALGLAAARRPG